MSLPARIKISEQANMIGQWIEEQTSGSNAVVEACANQRRLWEKVLSMSADDKPRVLIAFDGEVARGGFGQRNTLNRVDRQWVVVVLRGRGIGQAIGTAQGEVTEFLDFVEYIRQLCRRITSISEEPIDYMTTKPLPGVAQPSAANNFLDGYVVTFTTANDIPGITKLAPGQEPES